MAPALIVTATLASTLLSQALRSTSRSPLQILNDMAWGGAKFSDPEDIYTNALKMGPNWGIACFMERRTAVRLYKGSGSDISVPSLMRGSIVRSPILDRYHGQGRRVIHLEVKHPWRA